MSYEECCEVVLSTGKFYYFVDGVVTSSPSYNTGGGKMAVWDWENGLRRDHQSM